MLPVRYSCRDMRDYKKAYGLTPALDPLESYLGPVYHDRNK